MWEPLLIAVLAYLGVCYLYGMYLVLRLVMQRPLGQILKGQKAKRHVRPLTNGEPGPGHPEPTPPNEETPSRTVTPTRRAA